MKPKLYDPQLGPGEKNRWVVWVVGTLLLACVIVALLASNGCAPMPSAITPTTIVATLFQPSPVEPPVPTPTSQPLLFIPIVQSPASVHLLYKLTIHGYFDCSGCDLTDGSTVYAERYENNPITRHSHFDVWYTLKDGYAVKHQTQLDFTGDTSEFVAADITVLLAP